MSRVYDLNDFRSDPSDMFEAGVECGDCHAWWAEVERDVADELGPQMWPVLWEALDAHRREDGCP